MARRVDIEVDTLRARTKIVTIKARLDRHQILSSIGEEVREWTERNIRSRGQLSGGWAPIAANTRLRHRAPMIRTGRMLNSFGYTVTGNRVDMGSPDPVAGYQHFGTPPHKIRGNPFLRFPTVGGRVVTRAVNHPGTPPRQLIPNRRQAKVIGVRVVEEQVDGAA